MNTAKPPVSMDQQEGTERRRLPNRRAHELSDFARPGSGRKR